MAFSPGYKAFILIDNAAGSPQNLSGYSDDFSFPQNTDMVEVTTFGTAGVKEFVAGLRNGDTISMSGPLDVTLHSQFGSMLAAQAAGTTGFTTTYGPAGSVASAPKVASEVLVASYEVSTGVGGRAEYSASLQVTGAVTNSTW